MKQMLHNILLLMFSLALTAGCDLLTSGQKDPENVKGSKICKRAESCCKELNQATAYDEATAGVENANMWPNHCPSWKVQGDARCREFITHVGTIMPKLTKDHPVFESKKCAAPKKR